LLIIVACNPTRKIGEKFTTNPELPPILVLFEPELYINYHKPNDNVDSLLRDKPPHIDKIINNESFDTIAINYKAEFIEQLKSFGFNVFNSENISDFFSMDTTAYQMTFVQMTIEEHRVDFSDEIKLDVTSVAFDTIISVFEFNVWIDFVPVSNDTLPKHLLFSSHSVADKILGRFGYVRREGNYFYNYTFFPVNVDDIIDLSLYAAKNHANYLFDYFMNRYIYFKYRKSDRVKYYYTYDKETGKIYNANMNRFIFMK